MCNESKCGCQKPRKLKGKPSECSPAQIRECHGDIDPKKHPCDAKARK